MNNGRSNGRGRGRRGGSATAVANVVVQAQGLLKKLFALNSDAAAHTRVVFGEQLSTTLLFAVKTASSVEQQGLSALFYQFERDIDRILQDPRAPAPLKKAVALVVGAFGHLQMNTDHSYLRWLFDRLLAPSSPDMSKESRGEWKNWLLLALKEFLDPAPPYSYEAAHLRTEIPFLMGEMQNFLDAMEASDHLPKALDILHVIERRYPREFSVSFRDLVDLLIGWSIDPSTPRNISALIADSFKKFWRIWPDHLVFSLELAHHLLSDIQGILDGQSGVLQKEGDGGMKTNDRSQRRPLSIVLLIKCFHSVIYVITFSTFPTINAECRKPLLQPSDSLYTEYASVIKMGLEIFGTVATKFNDRGWLAQGAGLVKFLSRALQDEFLPFQEASVRYLEAECENILSECDVLGSTDSIRKDIEDWVDRFSEILDVWNPKFSSTLVISLCSLSKSCTLSRLRRVCVAYDDILVRIHKWISMLVTGLSSSSYLLPEPSALLRSFIGEILLETYFIAFSKQGLLDPIGCLTYDTRISHAILDAYNENAELHPYFDAIKDEEATTQTSLLRWNLELLGALIPLPACSDMGCSLLKFFHICIVGFDYNGGGKRDSHIEDVLDYLLLAAYEVCARNDFFVTIASFDDESALDSIFVQLAVIEYAMNTTPMSYDCKLIAATWFTSFTSRLDDVTSSTKFTPDMVSSVLPSVGRALVVLVTNLEFDVDPKIRNMIAEMVKNFTRWFSSVRIHVSAEQYKALRDLLFEVIIPRLVWSLLFETPPQILSRVFQLDYQI
ncbi:hypothetical protein DFS34DRAFT_497733 [Phlyctochytrium arcticum]|nr:hypothetical protein DFS34DRAFT_497733 [Phlyctochytrium arcticum]